MDLQKKRKNVLSRLGESNNNRVFEQNYAIFIFLVLC